MRMQLPVDVQKIIEILAAHGHEAYAVGGCVRDTLLSRTPKDWDITTDASPEEIKACFYKTIDTGIQHGTVTVMMHHVGYEVTTYRIDGDYQDSRHPSSVTFTKNLSEDLKRRDFTINAMAYNESGVVDLFDGAGDLERKIIRAVGKAEERFTEDALRIMRCIRFAAQLGFSIEADTFAAAKKLAVNLKNISRERVRDELIKTVESMHPEYITLFSQIGAMQEILPQFDPEDAKILALLKALPEDKVLRFAALFLHADSDPLQAAKKADSVLKELRFDNDTKNRIVHLVKNRDLEVSEDPAVNRIAVSILGKEAFPSWLQLISLYREKQYAEAETQFAEILEDGICTSIKELKITGNDLMEIGIPKGKMIGEILGVLLQQVLLDPEKNEPETLKKMAAAYAEAKENK